MCDVDSARSLRTTRWIWPLLLPWCMFTQPIFDQVQCRRRHNVLSGFSHAVRIADCVPQSVLSVQLFPNPHGHSTLLLVQGLLQFAEELYETAAETFSHLLDAERMREAHSSRGFLLLPKEGADFTRGCASRLALTESRDESLLSAGVNNLCLCLLHLKQNHTAIARLEALIGENPPRFMSEAVVFNLCTMYDLSYSPDASQQKKKVLQKVATRFGLVDPVLHWRSFRAT